MSDQTITLSEATYKALCEMASQSGQPVQDILARAVNEYRRKVFLEQVNAAYAALRADPLALAEVERERQSMAGCLMDGLDPAECWDEEGDLLPPDTRKDNG